MLVLGAAVAHLVFSHPLPPLAKRLDVRLVDVTYAPGRSSTPHTHDCPVIVYVVDGTIKSQVRGDSLHTYGPGSVFYEAPHALHAVSENASHTKPAHFVAFFVCGGRK